MHWYVVRSKVRQEQVAKLNLERQSYEIYLPMAFVWRRRRGLRVRCLEPMFSRYLFVRLDEGVDDWGPIRSTRGVVGMVRFAGVAPKVPEELIAHLKQMELGTQQDQDQDTFSYGQKVEIATGPFAGYQAMFAEKTSSGRVKVLLEYLGREMGVLLSLDDIEVS